jgi:pilus assembly protein CpaB
MKAARLVVLAVAVAAGGMAALLAGRSGNTSAPIEKPVPQLETVDVLVANTDIGQGTSVKPDQLRWQTWPAASAGPAFIRKSDRPDAIEQLAGSITRGSFGAGEPIRESRLIKANASGYLAAILPSGMRAVSTEISAETGAGGFIIPGDHVDVIVTEEPRENDKASESTPAVSETILTNIRVLAIDQIVEDKNGEKVIIGRTATLEVTPRQAEMLTQGRKRGTLSLALRSILDTGETKAEEDEGEPKQDINIVRFGVNSRAVK